MPSKPSDVELGLVERRVGDGEAALRREARQLRPAQSDLVGDGGLPVAQQVGWGDVVVVDELGLVARGDDVVDRAADGRLVQQPAVAPGTPELDHRPSLVLDIGRVRAVVDVRVEPRRAQAVAQVHRVNPDGVAAGERRNDLVDPHVRAVYKRAAELEGRHPCTD